jgi:hypothetical protein
VFSLAAVILTAIIFSAFQSGLIDAGVRLRLVFTISGVCLKGHDRQKPDQAGAVRFKLARSQSTPLPANLLLLPSRPTCFHEGRETFSGGRTHALATRRFLWR